jgi:L-ascorbate metabolism protein UlaG (beta-lactamase superfamily)
MEIKWHGDTCFTIKGKKTTICIDPYADGKLKNVKADTILCTNNYDGTKKLANGSENSTLIHIPGEYEIQGAAIIAIPAYTKEKEEGKTSKGRIIMFSLIIDNISICHLGLLGTELDDDQLSKIGNVDILMISAAGDNTLELKEAHKIIEEIEPRIIIPMNYKGDEIDKMLKEMGVPEMPESQDVFQINSKSSLPDDKTEFVILKES